MSTKNKAIQNKKDIISSDSQPQDVTVSAVLYMVKNSFKQLLYPKGVTCSFCGGELDRDFVCDVCIECENKLDYIKSACLKCGSESLSGDYCIKCKSFSFEFDQNISVTNYDDFAVNILFKLKNGDRYIAEDIAYFIHEQMLKFNIHADMLTCVPLGKKSYKLRGYNQSELIAREISDLSGIEFFADAIEKVIERDVQKQLSGVDRAKNLKDAFKANKNKADFKNKTVIIIDDVITTGATLSECSRALKKVGVKKVFCMTFSAVKHLSDFE